MTPALGMLLFEDCVLDDTSDGTAIWKTTTPVFGGSPTLRLAANLDGEFQINVGTLDLRKAVVNHGKLKHYAGSVTTDADAYAVLSDDDDDEGTACP